MSIRQILPPIFSLPDAFASLSLTNKGKILKDGERAFAREMQIPDIDFIPFFLEGYPAKFASDEERQDYNRAAFRLFRSMAGKKDPDLLKLYLVQFCDFAASSNRPDDARRLAFSGVRAVFQGVELTGKRSLAQRASLYLMQKFANGTGGLQEEYEGMQHMLRNIIERGAEVPESLAHERFENEVAAMMTKVLQQASRPEPPAPV